MTDYRFVTTWLVDAPVDRVFAAIHDSARWPEWWKGVRRADLLEDGDADGVGRLWRYEWRSRLPYSLTFDSRVTRAERPWRIEGQVHGELEGSGRWRFYESPHGTAAVYVWEVRTTRPWMNAIAPLARPVFAWNHDVVMSQGEQGIRRLLGAATSV
jgi:uncharacterized protein YndB with AHSA1/START domain